MKDAVTDFRKNEPCWCKSCRSAAEKKSKARPAYKALARDRSRIAMREKRQASDDALNKADRIGYALYVCECHAHIMSPVEEMEYAEYLREYRDEVFPLLPHKAPFPFVLSNPASQPRGENNPKL